MNIFTELFTALTLSGYFYAEGTGKSGINFALICAEDLCSFPFHADLRCMGTKPPGTRYHHDRHRGKQDYLPCDVCGLGELPFLSSVWLAAFIQPSDSSSEQKVCISCSKMFVFEFRTSSLEQWRLYKHLRGV